LYIKQFKQLRARKIYEHISRQGLYLTLLVKIAAGLKAYLTPSPYFPTISQPQLWEWYSIN